MFHNKLKTDAVSEAVAKILAQEAELSDKQKKIAKIAGDKEKIDAADLAALRAGKKPVEEGFDDMEKYLKDKNKPQPSGGAGKKQGSKYGGSKQKEEPNDDEEKMKKEEVEELDELRTSTLLRYSTKANQSLIGGDRNKEEKRVQGINRAVEKIKTRHTKEDVESVDEVMHVFHATSPGAKMQRFHKDSPDPQAAAHRNATAAAAKGLRASGALKRKSFSYGSTDDIKTPKGGTVMAMKREDAEQIDELSNKTLDSYKSKAYQDYRKQVKSGESGAGRVIGIARAQQKRSMKSEDTEQVDEKAPPGFEGTVKAMKKHKEIDNPFALAWYMKNKGAKSHKKADGSMKKEEYELDEEKPAVVKIKTNKPIGTRVADIGPGGKEYNVKTDKEWDKQKQAEKKK
jgi:hypothetical protein